MALVLYCRICFEILSFPNDGHPSTLKIISLKDGVSTYGSKSGNKSSNRSAGLADCKPLTFKSRKILTKMILLYIELVVVILIIGRLRTLFKSMLLC